LKNWLAKNPKAETNIQSKTFMVTNQGFFDWQSVELPKNGCPIAAGTV
jgi:hypothetical protein